MLHSHWSCLSKSRGMGEQTAQEPQENSHTLGLIHNYYYNDLQKFSSGNCVKLLYISGTGRGVLAQGNEDLLHRRGERKDVALLPNPLGLTPD